MADEPHRYVATTRDGRTVAITLRHRPDGDWQGDYARPFPDTLESTHPASTEETALCHVIAGAQYDYVSPIVECVPQGEPTRAQLRAALGRLRTAVDAFREATDADALAWQRRRDTRDRDDADRGEAARDAARKHATWQLARDEYGAAMDEAEKLTAGGA